MANTQSLAMRKKKYHISYMVGGVEATLYYDSGCQGSHHKWATGVEVLTRLVGNVAVR